MENAEWSVIKNEYVNTDMTQKELAEKYGVSISTLKKKSAKECWRTVKKCNLIDNTAVKIHTERCDAENAESEADRIVATSRKLHGIINRSIDEMTAAAENESTEGIDAGKIQKLAATLKILKEINGEYAPNDSAKEHSKLIKVIKEAVNGK